jgi:hypothetical protein
MSSSAPHHHGSHFVLGLVLFAFAAIVLAGLV